MNKAEKVVLSDPGNGGNEAISFSQPYTAHVTVTGVADFIFHGWDPEAVEEKGRAAKGSKAKKTDNINSYIYRDENNMLAIPGEYLRMCVCNAAKFRQDPRSPRKSAMDLYKAGIVVLNKFGSLGTEAWDYLDKRRVVVQRNGINRTRPAMRAGWVVSYEVMCLLPEYIPPHDLLDTIGVAGRLVGLGNFRPTYGRFSVTSFAVQDAI
jgi:hypothetical protein